MLEWPLYNSIKNKFPQIFENLVPRVFLHMDHQVDILSRGG